MNLVKSATIRGTIPFVIMTGITLIMRTQKIDSFQVKSTFVTGLIITIVSATTVIYQIGQWSLAKQSLVHFLFMVVTVLPCLIFSGWFPTRNIIDFLKIIGYFLVTGMILWSFAYLLFGKLFNR
ncbi:DUF3021 family protein [Levilactobacillus wangkuiensis]|uniref:DUF3021 family protein n=1 Tax=Levilactobacillus wangkuiensis TaxID=2799566 RepID=UPI001F334FC3|nr:DUF3021 family protein [Levilactobacillus wangkuiensis]